MGISFGIDEGVFLSCYALYVLNAGSAGKEGRSFSGICGWYGFDFWLEVYSNVGNVEGLVGKLDALGSFEKLVSDWGIPSNVKFGVVVLLRGQCQSCCRCWRSDVFDRDFPAVSLGNKYLIDVLLGSAMAGGWLWSSALAWPANRPANRPAAAMAVIASSRTIDFDLRQTGGRTNIGTRPQSALRGPKSLRCFSPIVRAGFFVGQTNGQSPLRSVIPLSAGRVNNSRRLTAAFSFRSCTVLQSLHCRVGSRLSFAFTLPQLEQVLLAVGLNEAHVRYVMRILCPWGGIFHCNPFLFCGRGVGVKVTLCRGYLVCCCNKKRVGVIPRIRPLGPFFVADVKSLGCLGKCA